MSLVFLHVGQCGNQLAQTFWAEMDTWSKPPIRASHKTPATKYTAGTKKPGPYSVTIQDRLSLPYCLSDGTLPCILVDSEPKVVQRCAKLLSNRVSKENVFTDRTGRGNNWAYGYRGRHIATRDVYEPSTLAEQVLEHVRKIVERCDRFVGTVLFQSLAGGTGSGLGSALVEHLRDEYPLAYIVSVLVAPFQHGETPLQHYNSLLSLSWIQHYCDCALLFQNDCVLEQLRKQVRRQAPGVGVRSGQESVDEMNTYISKCLSSVFQPLWAPKAGNTSCFELLDMVRSVCPDPATKFITPVHAYTTTTTTSWDQLVSSFTHPTQFNRCTSSMIFIARGNHSNIHSLTKTSQSLEHKLKQTYKTVEWNPFPVDFWLSQEPHLQATKSITVLANTSTAGDYIKCVYDKALVMFKEKAYLHWYQKYNCEQETFTEAFKNVHTIVENYSSL